MSYGLMIAVQFDRKDIFDRLWRWSKKYMQHQEGLLKGYFAWSCQTDGTRNAQGPASDGELYYVTSLIFASNRWGNSTGINYLAEAQNILNCSMQKIGMERVAPLINLEHQLITFTPDPFGGRFTDPSYHIPAFYEVWARWAEDGRSEFWRVCARKSREYLHKSIHPVTGLNPDYNNYDGTLLGSKRVIGDAFRFDSWRVPMNIALDYSWACADRKWQQEYGNKIQNFFYSQGIDSFVDQYNVDGTTVTELLGAGGYKKLRHSLGLVATTAAVSLVCTHDKSREFVDRLWNAKHVPYDDGSFDAYYERRSDIWVSSSGHYSSVLGFTAPYENGGIVDSWGVEIGANYRKKIADITLNIGANFALAKNEIIEQMEEPRMYDNLITTGKPLKQTYGMEVIGYFKDQADIENSPKQSFGDVKPGDIKYKDVNGDNIIDANDKVAIGHSTTAPEIYYSFNLGAEWKGLGFDAMFQGTGRYSAVLNTKSLYWPLINNTTISQEYYDNRWTPENQDAKYPRLSSQSNENNYQTNTLWLADRSFLKLRSIELYYKFPQYGKKDKILSNAKIYVRGVDLLLLCIRLILSDPNVYWSDLSFNS